MARQGIPVGRPPLVYPTVTVGGETYTLKFEIGAEFMLDQMGVQLQQLPAIFGNPKGPGKVALIMKLFTACVANNFVDRGEPAPSAEQWAHQITAEDFKAIAEAIPKAMLKAKPPAEISLQEPEANAGRTQ